MARDIKAISYAARELEGELTHEIGAARRGSTREHETLDADFDRLLGHVRDLAQMVANLAEASHG